MTSSRGIDLVIPTVWDGTWGSQYSPRARSRLSWRSSPASSRIAEMDRLTMDGFTRVLREAQILDNRSINAAGAAVILPYGVELLRRFRAKVDTALRTAGLAEHEYPHLVPAALTGNVRTVVDLHDRLLLVATESEMTLGNAPLVLTPSGEMVIYAHWARTIASRFDLPIRIYRRARYFRPVSRGRHAGRGVFHSAEHDDVFEFHCAHATRGDQQQDLDQLRTVVAQLIRDLHVPVLWSTRPPWTNHAEVANMAVAADAPLPLGLTAQVACLYDQGTRFSRPYGIGFRENGVFHHTEQVAGYVSRRLLMTHLMLGLSQRKRLFIHPEVAPVQLLMLIRQQPVADGHFVSPLIQAFRNLGLRVRTILCDTPVALNRAGKQWARRGVPLIMQVFSPRSTDDRLKIVIERADTGEELVVRLANLLDLTDELPALLSDLEDAFSTAVWNFARSRVHATGTDDLQEVLGQRLVAVCPLAANEQAARGIGALGKGEVLGYCRTDRTDPCVFSGAPVSTVAFISPRL